MKQVNETVDMKDMEVYYSNKNLMDVSLALILAKEFGVEDSFVVDFSGYHYTPGIVGITSDQFNYFVYEVDEHKQCNTILKTTSEKEACLAALNSLGISLK